MPRHSGSSYRQQIADFLLKPFDLDKFREVIDHNVKCLVKETSNQEVQKLNQKLERLLSVLGNGKNRIFQR